jgi:hypothetical protein
MVGSIGKSPSASCLMGSHQPTDAGVRGVVSSYMEEAIPTSLRMLFLRAYHLTDICDCDLTIILRCQPETREVSR